MRVNDRLFRSINLMDDIRSCNLHLNVTGTQKNTLRASALVSALTD